MKVITLLLYLFVNSTLSNAFDELVSKIDTNRFSINERRYLLYDVNNGEGFNLKRDVYMRIANLVRVLRESGHNFVLVLPPWGALYHWQTQSLGDQMKIPWNLFFDIESLNRFVPVVEFNQYLEERGRPEIDLVYCLQAYAEGWTHWEEKWHYRPCVDQNYYYYDQNWHRWRGWFFGYDNVYSKEFHCISIQGHASTLKPLILADNNTALSMMFDRAETVLHDTFGDVNYWKARRSMRYNKELVKIGDIYRQTELNSNDIDDNTLMQEDWTKDKVTAGRALGGPYLCVHWRRKDFVRAHSKELPSIQGTANQTATLLEKWQLNTVFLSTDALDLEVNELSSYLPSNMKLKRFLPTNDVLQKYKDGGVSIIDQWICSHARYFIGSHVSTFSFRIQEGREIMGFNSTTTFNRLCPDKVTDCEQPSKWLLAE